MKILLLCVSCLLCLTTAFGQVDTNFPKRQGWVNDFNNILTTKEEKKLEKLVRNFEKKTTNEICIVTIETIQPFDHIQDYAWALFDEWGIGKKEKNNGLLMLVCKPEKIIRITTGYGTEEILTNAICQAVLDQDIIPLFKENQYFKGVLNGTESLIAKWK